MSEIAVWMGMMFLPQYPWASQYIDGTLKALREIELSAPTSAPEEQERSTRKEVMPSELPEMRHG